MQMEDYILAVFTNFFRLLIIWRFMNLFFVPKVKQGKECVAYIVYLIIATGAYGRTNANV